VEETGRRARRIDVRRSTANGLLEVTRTTPDSPWPCDECLAREWIWRWLAKTGNRAIRVERLARGVEAEAFVRVYSHLRELVERYPIATRRGSIWLTFHEKGTEGDFGEWSTSGSRLSLPSRYYGSARGLAGLEERLVMIGTTGQSPVGCRTPEYVVTHEFGHSLRHRLESARYARWWMQSDKAGLGANGGRTYSEGFAEGFSVIRHAPSEQWSPTVRTLYEMLREDGVL